jgi:cytochrome c oxidase subunit 2
VLVIGFFAITARDMNSIEAPVDGSRNIQVIGKQWSWDFNYTESNVHETGIQSQFAGEKGSKEALPTLWLEKDVPLKVTLDARDVIHSFWVIDFLYKKDLIPGKTNYIYFTPTKLGDFDGKCAELCGEYHSMMLFNVKVVDKATYDAHMTDLQAQGNTGLLGTDLNRNQNLPGDNPDIRG